MSLNDFPEDGLENQNIYKKSHDANKICNTKSIAIRWCNFIFNLHL